MNGFAGASVFDVSGTRVSLPPIPLDDDFNQTIFEKVQADEPVLTPTEKESKSFLNQTTPEILNHTHKTLYLKVQDNTFHGYSVLGRRRPEVAHQQRRDPSLGLSRPRRRK